MSLQYAVCDHDSLNGPGFPPVQKKNSAMETLWECTWPLEWCTSIGTFVQVCQSGIGLCRIQQRSTEERFEWYSNPQPHCVDYSTTDVRSVSAHTTAVVPGTNLVWYWLPVLLCKMKSSTLRHNAVCHVVTTMYLSSASWRLRWLNYSCSCPGKWSSDTGTTLLLTDRDRSLSAALTAGGSLNW